MHILRQVWEAWRAFGRFMGDLVGRVVMTVFYFTLALPFGLAVRLLSDPLRLKPEPPRWNPRAPGQSATLDDARRMF